MGSIDLVLVVVNGDSMKYAKKSGKLKGQKLFKFQKLSKSENSPKFGAKKVKSNFLTFGAKEAFNSL